MLFGVYEEEVTRLFHQLSSPAWTVLDVGANVGYFSLVAAEAGGIGARIFAFEPNPQMATLLRRTLALNGRSQVELVAAACGERDDKVELHLSPDPHNTGLSTVRHLAGTKRLTVNELRLDTFCAEHDVEPDLIKIDVEGAEDSVLRGAEGLLRRGIPKHVICEVWEATRSEVVSYMADLGYTAHAISPGGTSGSAEDGITSNVYFRHDSSVAKR